jgi:hypothetical protein
MTASADARTHQYRAGPRALSLVAAAWNAVALVYSQALAPGFGSHLPVFSR